MIYLLQPGKSRRQYWSLSINLSYVVQFDIFLSLANVVLEECDDAVALVLADHYQGLRYIPQEVLNYALTCTKKRNSKGVPVRIFGYFYNNKFRDMRNVTGLSLMEEVFIFIDSKKLPLFVRF
jgi:hypothetical protein